MFTYVLSNLAYKFHPLGIIIIMASVIFPRPFISSSPVII